MSARHRSSTRDAGWPDHEREEQAWVARIREGDEGAFRALFFAYSLELVAYGARLVGSEAIAEEIVHDVLLKVWQSRATWMVRDTARSYLFAAVRNRAITLLKHERVEWRWRARMLGEARAAGTDSIEESRQNDAWDAAVAQAVAELPHRCRLVFTLRWQRGLSYAEVAKVTGLSVRTVENHLARAIKSLRQRFTGWRSGSDDEGETAQ